MKVIIRRDDNELEKEFELTGNETIYNLKEMISKNNFGPIIKEQRLEYCDNGRVKRLKNSHNLAYYEIQDNCIIILKHQSASSSSSNASSPYGSDEENF